MSEVNTGAAGLEKELAAVRSELEEVRSRLGLFEKYIPGGIFSYNAQNYKFDFISPNMLKMFSCTEEEFRERYYDSFNLLILKEDRKNVLNSIEMQQNFEGFIQVAYRIKGAMDEILSVGHIATLVKNGDREIFWVYIYDRTEEVTSIQALRELTSRYEKQSELLRLIKEATNDIIYDYSVTEDRLESSKTPGKPIEDFAAKKVVEHVVHPDDVSILSAKLQDALVQEVKNTVEYRLANPDGIYRWYRLNYASFADEFDKVYRVVGLAKDVSEEKRVQQELKAQAEKDGMTGLLNKVTIRDAVEDYLRTCDIGSCHAMIMIDTDHFKDVNDNLGHAMGDEVIKEVANSIRKIFRETDFVGRVGGDEFLVFMKHTTPVITQERA
ncbi:MAG: diguanylate cyclase, partial [Lachnospiraceae bacterium]|nr:diguanylate cyclase [Lachnospiraceae bacterium]